MAKVDDDLRDDNKFFVYDGMLNIIKRYKLELTGGTVTGGTGGNGHDAGHNTTVGKIEFS